MAVNLLDSNSARVSFGDLAALAGLTQASFALTFKPTTGTSSSRALFSQWGATAADISFLLWIVDTDEVEFWASQGAGGSFTRKTSTANLASGSTYRIVGTWITGSTMHIYINGVDFALTSVNSSSVPALQNASTAVTVGRNFAVHSGADGDYSEVAIWNRVLTADEAYAYGQGYTPAFFKHGGLHYWPLGDTGSLTDQWGGANGTNTSGTDATHPTIISPTAPALANLAQMGARLDAAAGSIRVTQAYAEFVVSDTVTASTLAIFDHHYKQQGIR